MMTPRADSYRLVWSEEDREWIATCDAFPSLSHLSDNPLDAMRGVLELVEDCIRDIRESPPESLG